MTFGSCFSGIGGLDLGFECAGLECRWQVELDPFTRAVLTKYWPNVPKYADVRDVGSHNLERVDVIAGGFPCQDISYAGYGAGITGERSGLWYQMARVISELGPRFVIVENVAALLDRGLGDVLGTLADLGFDAEWSDLSACALGASHPRQRVFIVAYANGEHGRQGLRDSVARAFRPLQAIDSFESSRAGTRARLANPSALYGGAHGLPDGLHRNRGIGNAVYPPAAEWLGRRLMECQ